MTQSKPVDQKTSTSQRTTLLLLATDNSRSIIGEIVDGKTNAIAYSAYGQQSGQQEVTTRLGFNGQLREMQTSWYVLGNGYRVYNPRLMRFHSPDSWSPFGRGWLNPYMYCAGDPVNRGDPSGHGPWEVIKLFIRENLSFGSSQATLNARVAARNARSIARQTIANSFIGSSAPQFVDTTASSFLPRVGEHLDSLPKWRPRPNTASLPEQSGHGDGGVWPTAMSAHQSSARRGNSSLNTSSRGRSSGHQPDTSESSKLSPSKQTPTASDQPSNKRTSLPNYADAMPPGYKEAQNAVVKAQELVLYTSQFRSR